MTNEIRPVQRPASNSTARKRAATDEPYPLAVAWEVGYLRGVTDDAGDMERADNPYLPATDDGADR